MMIRSTSREHKTPVAIAAFDHAAIVDFKPDARVAKGCAAGDVACAVAGDPAGFDRDGFGLIDHGLPLSNAGQALQFPACDDAVAPKDS